MDIPIQVDLGRIAQDLQIRRVQVESVVQLLDEGNTVPFITRYRKERTGNLNEVVIHEIQIRVQRLRELAERKETILKAIEAQGKLTPDLTAAIRAADNPKRLEDLYLPFKPKKRTKASDARDRGLEPLAFRIWTRDETLTDLPAAAQEFVNAEKGIDTVEKVLEGVGHILAEAISEMATVRDGVRKVVWKTGKIVTTKAEMPEGQGLEYRDYFDYSEPIVQIPPHRILAINRGDKEGPLKVRIDVARPDLEAVLFSQLPLEGHPHAELFRASAIDALERLILPGMEREVRRDLTEGAEKHAVEVFAKNLRGLLLQPPIPKQVVLAIDPGFRTGCKLAVLDRSGNLVDQAVIYPHAQKPRFQSRIWLANTRSVSWRSATGRLAAKPRSWLPRSSPREFNSAARTMSRQHRRLNRRKRLRRDQIPSRRLLRLMRRWGPTAPRRMEHLRPRASTSLMWPLSIRSLGNRTRKITTVSTTV
jgi:protein Tex